MNQFVRRFLRLVLPLVLECLDEALSRRDLKEGQRTTDSKVSSND